MRDRRRVYRQAHELVEHRNHQPPFHGVAQILAQPAFREA
jgi:hypothetical protein